MTSRLVGAGARGTEGFEIELDGELCVCLDSNRDHELPALTVMSAIRPALNPRVSLDDRAHHLSDVLFVSCRDNMNSCYAGISSTYEADARIRTAGPFITSEVLQSPQLVQRRPSLGGSRVRIPPAPLS